MANSLRTFSGGNSYIDPQSSNEEILRRWAELQETDPEIMGEQNFTDARTEIMNLMNSRGLSI